MMKSLGFKFMPIVMEILTVLCCTKKVEETSTRFFLIIRLLSLSDKSMF